MSKKEAAERLMQAIGEVRDEYITEAMTPYAHYERKKWATTAASLALVTVLALGAIRILPALGPAGSPSGGSSAPSLSGPMGEDDYSPENSTGSTESYAPVTGDGFFAFEFDVTNDKIEFTLVLQEDKQWLNFTLVGTDASGNYTEISSGDFGARDIIITVDNEAKNELPTSKGTYRVTLDISNLNNSGFNFKSLYVDSVQLL